MAIFAMYLRCYDIWLQILWAISLAILLFFLFMTSLSNPGIALRHEEPVGDDWIWNDQARTFRSPRAKYDPVCAVIVEEFDHTCPWVGMSLD